MPRPYKWWTTTEHRTILLHIESHSDAEIALMLGRTADQLERYCRKNNIKRSKEYLRKRNVRNATKLPPLETTRD